MSNYEAEVRRGDRFSFGVNWTKFLTVIDDKRVAIAQKLLADFLETPSLEGKTFIDVGCGSGLFSLAARRLGAKVFSFDYDPQSVACATELRKRFVKDDPDWTISVGSVLDVGFLGSLGQFDVVYSWGVLHHTGRMWEALANVTPLVAPGGKLFISVYNDQGIKSRLWSGIKRAYCRLPAGLRWIIVIPCFVCLRGPVFVLDFIKRGNPFYTWIHYNSARGMSSWHDLIDWVGGYPFEVAKPEVVFEFCKARGFRLTRLFTSNGIGCNEFVFQLPHLPDNSALPPR